MSMPALRAAATADEIVCGSRPAYLPVGRDEHRYSVKIGDDESIEAELLFEQVCDELSRGVDRLALHL